MSAQSSPPKTITKKTDAKTAVRHILRERVAQYLQFTLLFPEASKMEIAEKMGIARQTLYKIIKEGYAAKLIEFDDPLDRIDYEIIPKIVDNLNFFLDAKDKTVTIEAAKGTLFRAYQEAKGISDGSNTVLALRIEQADGSDIKVLTGHIVGKPKGLSPLEESSVLDKEAN